MKTKKIFLVLSVLFLFVLNFTSLNAQWEACNNGLPGVNDEITGGFIIDGKNIYVGIDGGIFMTTDNGDNWLPKNNGLKAIQGFRLHINNLAKSGNNIFACIGLQGVFMSSDKGENWLKKNYGLPYNTQSVDTIINLYLNSMVIKGNNIFIGNGPDEGIYLSTDNGDHWAQKNNGLQKSDTILMVYSLAASGSYIYAGTNHGIFITTDNGEYWSSKNKGIENLYILSVATKGNNIYIVPSANYIGTGCCGMYLSTDNGENWKYSGLDNSIGIFTIIFKSNYIIVGGEGIYLSSDNGSTWLEKNLGLPSYCIRALIINGDYIFAGTCGNGICRAKLSDLGITNVSVQDNNTQTGFEIHPNPASVQVKLKYGSTCISKVQISIFDLLGNEVFSSSEDCNIGTNEKVIDCHSLGTGYYIIRLKQGERVETKPVVIIKN
ncbi:MAG: T9SS type A sorting domain-containing protein [FCB group bacterium]|jgi:photosystem II stability/assembly factor-like uncharacterized protein